MSIAHPNDLTGLMSDEDFVIYDAKWILESSPGKKTLAYTESYNKPLLAFLLSHKLLVRPLEWSGFADWASFSLKKSDLTKKGFEIIQKHHDKWLSAIDKNGTIKIDIFEKAIQK